MSHKSVSLVSASMEDLRQGGVIYIRGQRAVITSLDFPLVFFRFDGEDRIRHRSFTASRDLFQVEDDIKPMSSVFSEPLSPTSQPGQHSRNNSSSDVAGFGAGAGGGSGAGPSPSDEKSSPLVKQQAEVVPHPEPEEAKRNLLNAFASRPTRVTIENKGTEQVVSEAATPRGVYINNCHGTTFDFVNKVASLTVHNCSNLKLSFSGTIQNAEFINCRDSEIVSTESCPLWTLSNCQNVDLRFLGTSAATFLASGENTVGNVLVAAPPPGDEFSRQDKELQFEPPAAAVVAEPIPENPQAAPVNPSEWRTRWNVEGWHFGEIEKLQRSGPQGYTLNL